MSVGEAGLLENLVTQFSSALDCFRELVQNSIDAGTPAVEVWLEFERGEGHMGVITIHIDDFGEGMDEAIIDNQLTCLFSSTKEDDLTKIGKFGIGFVSVFALKPKGVLVSTGRGGQYWEVFFHEDRSFTKSEMDIPTEGTQITIFKEGNYRQYREYVEGIEAILRHWCAHAETEITIEDRSPPDGQWSEPIVINEPFAVEGDCHVESIHQGTHIVMAYNKTPIYGFYNRGLTLALETIGENVLDHRTRRYSNISFKIKSRYLEHTLSRETVMRDENYEKAMKLVDETARDVLFKKLLSEIYLLLELQNWSHKDVQRYTYLMNLLQQESLEQIVRIHDLPLFRLLDGKTTSLMQMFQLLKNNEELLFCEHRTPITDALSAQGVPVVFGLPWGYNRTTVSMPRTALSRIFSRYAEHCLAQTAVGKVKRFYHWALNTKPRFEIEISEAIGHPEDMYMPVVMEQSPSAQAKGLIKAADSILRKTQSRYKLRATCRLANHSEASPLFVVGPTLSNVMRIPYYRDLLQAKSLEAAINIDHPHAIKLLALYSHQPQLAAYCLAKDLLLDQDQMLDLDMSLIKSAQVL